MAVEGGMKCVKFLLYVLLLAFCVSGERGRRGVLAGCGATRLRRAEGRGASDQGSWRPDVGGKSPAAAEASAAVPSSSFREPLRLVWADNGRSPSPPALRALPVR